jgi:hypothetical protein
MGKLSTILIFILIIGCYSNKIDVPIINFSELETLRCQAQEPKVSQWFYIGSENGYHWFVHRDLPEDKYYLISISDYQIEDPKIIMNDEAGWVLMPWGPGSEICNDKDST